MRFDPKGMNLFFVLSAFLMATFISNAHAANSSPSIKASRVNADPLTRNSQNLFAPFFKQAPQNNRAKNNIARNNIDWSETRTVDKASFTKLRSRLKAADEYAALYALQTALSRIGDGQTYIWGRPKRKLRAFITPLSSFRGKQGNICRQVVVSLALGSFMKRIETTACRASDKSWQLQS